MKMVKSILSGEYPKHFFGEILLSLVVGVLFLTYCPFGHIASHGGLRIMASCVLVVFCFLCINRIVSFFAIWLKAEKLARINDLAGIVFSVLVFVCVFLLAIYRTSDSQIIRTDSFVYFKSHLDQNAYDSSFQHFESLFEPESWELTCLDSTPCVRLRFATCLTEEMAKTYRRLFLSDYDGASLIQIRNTGAYEIITAEGETLTNDKLDGGHYKSLICRKGKTVVILQTYGSQDLVSKSVESFQQLVVSYFLSEE